MIFIYNINKNINNINNNFIYINAKLESELTEFSDEDAKKYLQETGIEKSGLDKLILESYKILNLITFFTSGPK